MATVWSGKQRFWTDDHRCYTSAWFAGTHRIMIGFGCNHSPWYDPSPDCPGRQGIHHGIDIDMPVGTPIRSAVEGTVLVRPSTIGRAYGEYGLVVRSNGRDIVLGHMSELSVRDGQHVSPGDQLGRSGMSAVESMDGPHLHFEVRPAGQTYKGAVDPSDVLGLHRQS